MATLFVETDPFSLDPKDFEDVIQPHDTLGYLKKLFEPQDWVNLMFIHQTETYPDGTAKTNRYFDTLKNLLDPVTNTVSRIKKMQDHGYNAFVCMNALTAPFCSSRKIDVTGVRNVYLDIDYNGEENIARVKSDAKEGIIPRPHFIINSSPMKFYVVWQVRDFTANQQEALLKALVSRYGGDPSVVNVNRVLRLPGTRNLKYPEQPLAEIIEQSYDGWHSPDKFKVEFTTPSVDYISDAEQVQASIEFYESACDEADVPQGTKKQWNDEGAYIYLVDCPNWEQHSNKSKTGAFVIIQPSGAYCFSCHHAHCKEWDWNRYREYLETEAEKPLRFGETGPVPVMGGDNEIRSLTDLGNAERFVIKHGENVRFCDKTGFWFVWEGTRWIRTGKTGPMKLMQETIREIASEAELTNDSEFKKKIKSWAKKSESNTSVTGAINQSKGIHDIRVSMSDFDADRFLLNLQNGTYNLKTHEFREFNKSDLISKMAFVKYAPKATCPKWLAYLESSIPDADTRRFLQQAAGYTLTGDASEDCLFLNIGLGRNGKGVFVNTLKALLGDYAMQADFQTFAAQKGGSITIRTDIARLAGARLVVSSENDQEQRIAEGLIKNLTGSDTITARKLFQEEEEYLPQFKLWFGVNNEPRITGTDEGIWSRIHLIHWTVVIPPEKRDATLKEVFKTTEASGIFNWLIQGLKDYQANRLVPSTAMLLAGEHFRRNQDQVLRFLDDECSLGEGLSVSRGVLYSKYKSWAESIKEFVLKDRQFKAYLESKQFVADRTNSGKIWRGITLKGTQIGKDSHVVF